jgi:hypothetical protein
VKQCSGSAACCLGLAEAVREAVQTGAVARGLAVVLVLLVALVLLVRPVRPVGQEDWGSCLLVRLRTARRQD